MSVNARPGNIRPNSTPAYYLGRPASLWIAIAGSKTVPDVGRQTTGA
jgi:hypothetical protein